MIKRTILAAAAVLCSSVSAFADPIKPEDYKTPHATGCMILRECTDKVVKISSVQDLINEIPLLEGAIDQYEEEINSILSSLEMHGVKVFLGNGIYFPVNHRGIYHTEHNRMFLNKLHMYDVEALLEVVRHEGWHAVQDIMAGTIDNSQIAIVRPEEDVPRRFAILADVSYAGNPRVLPWEREAKWAGLTPGMTDEALKAALKGPLWETYEPTPLTREWLVKNGFIVE